MEKEQLIYDRECIRCHMYPECKGKPLANKGKGCLKYMERSKEDEIHATRIQSE